MNSQEPIVVMADDDDDDCMLAREAFRESRAIGAFACFKDGLELMEYLLKPRRGKTDQDSLPALILLDLNMPRKDGRQALREIKSNPVLQKLPVVVLTTSREEEDIAFSRRMGADRFITKPITFDEWVKMMQFLARTWLGLKDKRPV